MMLTTKITNSDGNYNDSDINTMLQAIAIYKKLTKDPKSIVANNIVPTKPYLNDETEIKAAQKVDKAFKALDKTDDKYVTKLKQVKKDYDALSSTAQNYVTSDITTAVNMTIYKTPSDAAKAFENLIVGVNDNDANALINKYPLTYADVEEVVKTNAFAYEKLSSKAKSLVDSGVMKIYNKYAPIVEIVETLNKITPPISYRLDNMGYESRWCYWVL